MVRWNKVFSLIIAPRFLPALVLLLSVAISGVFTLDISEQISLNSSGNQDNFHSYGPRVSTDSYYVPFRPNDSNSVSSDDKLRQFTSSGHVLGFGKQAVYLAGLDHALRVEFNGGRPVQPLADESGASGQGTTPLSKVSYSDVWKNIDVIYSTVAGGIAESTYIIHPGGNPEDIKLRYNTPVILLQDGSLSIGYKNGYLAESAPVAWQDIDGKHLPVTVQFQINHENQIGFLMGNYNDNYTMYIDPVYSWHTFFGSASADRAYAIACDANSNIYIGGYSDNTWTGPSGTAPLHANSGGLDLVIIKLNSAGDYQWHTFYGSTANDEIYSLVTDSSSNIYAGGRSYGTWNGPGPILPLHAYSGSADIVILKLNSAGTYQWHTFYGSNDVDDYGFSIAIDPSNNVYLGGASFNTWNGPGPTIPLHAYSGGWDMVIIKLNSVGVYQWHAFYGSTSEDSNNSLVIDSNNNIYMGGRSYSGWNGPGPVLPLNTFSGSSDMVILKLTGDGTYQWHTFYGSASHDTINSLVIDSNNNVYAGGWSEDAWNGPSGNAPLHTYSGDLDIVVLKLNSAGAYQWHTFYGSAQTLDDYILAMDVDSSNNILCGGISGATWDGPSGNSALHAHSGLRDMVILKLSSAGAYQWHTFYGSNSGMEIAYELILDSNNNLYVGGSSEDTWNGPSGQLPLHLYSGSEDITILKLSTSPSTVTTVAATSINTNSATLNMNYTRGDYGNVDVRFAYKMSTDVAWTYTSWVTKSADGTHTAALAGLDPLTQYDFKAQLKYNSTEIEGSILQFTTLRRSSASVVTPLGIATFTISDGSIAVTGPTVAVTTPCGIPSGFTFPYGTFTFSIIGITPGSTVIVTITLPVNVPTNIQYWKCINGSLVNVTSSMGDNDGDNILTLTIRDGGPGDADGLANGVISDPGGPVLPIVAPAVVAPPEQIPLFRKESSSPQTQNQISGTKANLSVKYLNVQPRQAQINQPITIAANIVNGGDESGKYTVALKINGQIEQTKTGTISGHVAQPITFSVSKDIPGAYTVDINGQVSNFTITGQAAGKNTINKSIILYTVLAVMVLVVIILAIIVIKRRQDY